MGAEAITLVDDPERPGNRLLRLRAHTDGTPAGTVQAQACHQRKALRGTFAARVRFSAAPGAGVDGDPVVQTFYLASPLAHDYDPASARSTSSTCPTAAGAAHSRACMP